MNPNLQQQFDGREWLAALQQAAVEDAPADGVSLLAEQAERVLPASEFIAEVCRRRPSLLLEQQAAGQLQRRFQHGELAALLDACLSTVETEAQLSVALRRFRQAQMLRIVWRDLAGLADLDETLEDLSELADRCLQAALERLYTWECARLGTPRNDANQAQSLVVLGMGKLGARELNLSSDIDLIFAFPEHGEVDGRRPLPNQQFFTRLCQKLIKALGEMTAEGFVFRVDTRLRPFGDSGPLVVSFEAMESYYADQARDWERYAMVKARVVAGDRETGAELMRMLRAFVYRRYLDFNAIAALRGMKALIVADLARKGMDANIKLGAGGIREIEFIGQSFQLVRGGREPELRVRPIQQVLGYLGERGLLPNYTVRELIEAYRFLRRLENRIQAWQDQQTHLLPADEPSRQRLSISMGFADTGSFLRQLEQHRRRVQGHFDSAFVAPQVDDSTQANVFGRCWQSDGGVADLITLLLDYGMDDALAGSMAKQLVTFRSRPSLSQLGQAGRSRFEQLMPLLLRALVGMAETHDEAARALRNLLELLETIARRTAYLALLVEYPLALSQLVRLALASPWILRQLARQPILLDELLDPRRLYDPLRPDELDAELAQLLESVETDDLETLMDRLRQFAHSNLLRVAAADITGVLPLMVVSDYLSWIAEAVLERVLVEARAQLVRRHGEPSAGILSGQGIAIFGYGKLGGRELGYGSDLDLVFICEQQPGGVTAGPRSISNETFHARLGQRMIHLLTTRTVAGPLYEVDMRLRPNGNSGQLVTSLEAFEIYQRESAWTWEHQALVRARFIAGDPRLGQAFSRLREEILARPRDPVRLSHEVREMREKMRASLDRGGETGFDLKQGEGGIADIEFLVQYAVLRWASEIPQLTSRTDNLGLLQTLAEQDLLGVGVADRLAQTYRDYRAAYHRAILRETSTVLAADAFREERIWVVEQWRRLLPGDVADSSK